MAQTNWGGKNPLERELGRAGQPGASAHDLLDDDHNRILQLLNEYRNAPAASPEQKHMLARAICRELKIHTQIEEEIYYPRVREKADVDDRVDKAEAEHDQVKGLIRNVEAASPQDASFDVVMKALGDAVRHHISEERHQLFDVAEVMGCNTPEMARALAARKRELMSQLH